MNERDKNNAKRTNAKFTLVGFGSAYFSVAIVVILLFVTVFAFVVQIASGGTAAAERFSKTDAYRFLSSCVTPLAIAVSGLVFCKAFGCPVKEACRVEKTEPKYFLYALLLIAASFFGLSSLNGLFIDFLVKCFGYKYTETTLPSFSAGNFVLTILTVCLLPAVFEEAFFRGILTRSLAPAGRLFAALICGAYFSLFHMNPAQTPYQFVVGFCFCLLALDSGSVLPTVFAHFLNNLVIVVLAYAFPSFSGFSGVWLIVSLIFGLACLVLFLYLTLKGKVKAGKTEYGYDYKTFFVYSAIGVAACAYVDFGAFVMIKIRIVAVGKVKEKYFSEAIAEYSKRLTRFCEFSVVEVKEENYEKATPAAIEKILAAEGERIEKSVKGLPVCLAIEEKKFSSEEFATFIKDKIDRGTGEITFIIGGSYGIEKRIKDACKDKISFSAMTFPHTLARVMLAEQIYRAFTIIAGAEYHK